LITEKICCDVVIKLNYATTGYYASDGGKLGLGAVTLYSELIDIGEK
jgi:hypothetical protein